MKGVERGLYTVNQPQRRNSASESDFRHHAVDKERTRPEPGIVVVDVVTEKDRCANNAHQLSTQ